MTGKTIAFAGLGALALGGLALAGRDSLPAASRVKWQGQAQRISDKARSGTKGSASGTVGGLQVTYAPGVGYSVAGGDPVDSPYAVALVVWGSRKGRANGGGLGRYPKAWVVKDHNAQKFFVAAKLGEYGATDVATGPRFANRADAVRAAKKIQQRLEDGSSLDSVRRSYGYGRAARGRRAYRGQNWGGEYESEWEKRDEEADELARELGFTPSGQNADWSVTAWHVGPSGSPNMTAGDVYVLEDEEADEPTYLVVRRWYVDDGHTMGQKYLGLPKKYWEHADGQNDVTVTIGDFPTFAKAAKAAIKLRDQLSRKGQRARRGGSMTKKITEAQLRERLHVLWMAGDAAIMSNYRNVPTNELWEEYGWVADQPADLFDFLRGDTGPRRRG